MKSTTFLKSIAFISIFLPFAVLPVAAEVSRVTLAKQYGIGSLTFMVMEHEKLYEKALTSANIDHPVSVEWVRFAGGTVMNDAILSGDLTFALAGVGPLVTMWAKTRENANVKGVCAVNAMPMLLNTRNPNIRTIADFTDKDRIALPGVKVSMQAVLLQMAAAAAFGETNFDKLDPLTVTLSHGDGMAELLSPSSPISAHFTAAPYTYAELEHMGIRTILNSYQILGGVSTQNVVYTTAKFRTENPRVYKAFLKAFSEATDFINQHREEAAEIYLKVSNDKTISKEQLKRILNNPEIKFTMTPERTMVMARFLSKIGRLKIAPDGWRDMFFPEIHGLPGS